MNMYGIEAMDIVRAQASRQYSSLPVCDSTNYQQETGAYLDGGVVTPLDPTESFCSEVGPENGTCEPLTMPKGSENFFYRELTFTSAGTSPLDPNDNTCVSMRVEVHVGLLVNAGETDPPRGNLSEKTIVGYVFR
jgi:hypothetical protein